MIDIRKFVRSLKYATRGIVDIAKREQSFRLQLIIAVVILVLLIFTPIDMWERILLILMIAAVLILEVINSIFERISDALKPRFHPMVREVKDMMAGAVLLMAITATVVAVLIFWPYVRLWL